MKHRIIQALESLGYTIAVIGGRTIKITATRPGIAGAHVDIYIRNGFDSYQSWQHISGGKVIAHNYSHGDVLDYLKGTN